MHQPLFTSVILDHWHFESAMRLKQKSPPFQFLHVVGCANSAEIGGGLSMLWVSSKNLAERLSLANSNQLRRQIDLNPSLFAEKSKLLDRLQVQTLRAVCLRCDLTEP